MRNLLISLVIALALTVSAQAQTAPDAEKQSVDTYISQLTTQRARLELHVIKLRIEIDNLKAKIKQLEQPKAQKEDK